MWPFYMTIVYFNGFLEDDAMSAKRGKPPQEVAISEFKAKCLSLLDEVSKTKSPLRVTRRGKAIADVIPASPKNLRTKLDRIDVGSIEIVGDIVSPVVDREPSRHSRTENSP